MKIALIDDELQERENITNYLSTFSNSEGTAFDIKCFESGEQFLKEFRLVYDIIFLDIEMSGINGMETAKMIRLKDKSVSIIFITNSVSYAVDGYSVEAVDYILKPVIYMDFAMKLKKVLRKSNRTKDFFIKIDALDLIKTMNTSEIYYVEVLGHYLIYHTKDGDIKSRGTMKEVTSRLIPYNFCRVHKCYLVNLNFVTEVKTGSVTVLDQFLPLGRVYKDKFKKEFMDFI